MVGALAAMLVAHVIAPEKLLLLPVASALATGVHEATRRPVVSITAETLSILAHAAGVHGRRSIAGAAGAGRALRTARSASTTLKERARVVDSD